MNCKITIARSLSRILFATLYVIDIVGLYYVSGDVSLAMSGAVAIWVILFIQMGISLLSLRVHSLTNCKRGDAKYLKIVWTRC